MLCKEKLRGNLGLTKGLLSSFQGMVKRQTEAYNSTKHIYPLMSLYVRKYHAPSFYGPPTITELLHSFEE